MSRPLASWPRWVLAWVLVVGLSLAFLRPLSASIVPIVVMSGFLGWSLGPVGAILPVLGALLGVEGVRLLRHPGDGEDPNSIVLLSVYDPSTSQDYRIAQRGEPPQRSPHGPPPADMPPREPRRAGHHRQVWDLPVLADGVSTHAQVH